jgi:iron complex transport system ATP-binding protein
VLVVLHDLNLAARYADRLLLLHEGRVSTQGTPWEVLQVELLEQVFKVPVSVQTHPLHACPLVLS